MKHEEISMYTKKALSEALKEALKTKPFKKITVSELIESCNINRKTFYYHFEDIYALLVWTFEQEAINVVKHFDLMVDSEEALTFIMDYVEENNYIINCVYDSMGQDELKRFFVKDFNDIILSLIEQAEECYGRKLNDGYKTFLSTFYVDATAGILIDWVKDRNRHNREVYIEYIKNTLQNSLKGIFEACDGDGYPKNTEPTTAQ